MFLTADRIHNGKQWLPPGTAIEVAEDGTIVAVHNNTVAGAKHYDGVLCPGFVNVHCHLELSHMKGAIPEKTGLVSFLQQVMMRRNGYTEEQKAEARQQAFDEMLANGIVAVGDICNTTDTTDLRTSNKMHFHSFVESIGFTQVPQKQFEYATQVYNNFTGQKAADKNLAQSIVPHAPYSVSDVLFGLIDKHRHGSIISIHNQESREEDKYYLLKEGGVQTLLRNLGIDDGFFMPSGKSSLQTYLQWLSPSHPVIFVHNTYTTRNDVEVAKTLLPHVYWCLCPNANLYIEDTLPNINMLMEESVQICIGTDSLSSNHQLSILEELKTVKKEYPHIDWAHMLCWATFNGACALQMSHLVGSFTPGLQPGIINIHGDYSYITRLF
jgi:aminodeoxyfutalosine deaminase